MIKGNVYYISYKENFYYSLIVKSLINIFFIQNMLNGIFYFPTLLILLLTIFYLSKWK